MIKAPQKGDLVRIAEQGTSSWYAFVSDTLGYNGNRSWRVRALTAVFPDDRPALECAASEMDVVPATRVHGPPNARWELDEYVYAAPAPRGAGEGEHE